MCRRRRKPTRIIKEMNKQAKEANNRTKALEQRQKLNEKLSSMQQDFLKSKKVKPNHKAPENLKPGDRVYVISFDQNGEVLTAPDKNKEVMVQMGIMKMKVPMAELMLDDTPRPKEKQKRQQPTKAKFSKSQFISAEIDCRGQLVDEAIANIDKYIDDAYLSGLKQVVIIHGKGTGAAARRGAELSENEFSCKKLQTRYLRRRRSRCYGGGIKIKGGFLNRGEEDGKTEDFGCG